MGARAPRASRVERGGDFSDAVSTLISLSLSLIVSAGSHTTHQLHTPHTAHTPGSRQAAALRVGLAPVPPPRALCAVTRTHALASTLSLSPSYSKTQKTRVGIREGERQSACADATRPPPPEPHVGGHTSGHRSWGAGRGPADAWPGVWRVACRSRAERGVHSARAEVRRGSGLASWPKAASRHYINFNAFLSNQ
jgi:hypothetical protein